MQKPYFIVNPIAGSGRSERCFEEVRAMLDEKGIAYDYVMTQRRRHASELTAAALERGERFIVAVGGDGTASEVASVLCGTDAVMGFLPFGTGNDFARATGLPEGPKEALDVLMGGHVRKLDAGRANDKYFINVAGVGFDVDVLINTEKYKKRFNGMLPYMLGILKALFHLRTLHMTVTADGEKIEQDTLLIAVGNGTHFGGGMKVTPEADPFDGQFDVCLVRRVGVLRFLSLLPGFIQGKHIESGVVRYFRASDVKVECPEYCVLDLDGELDSSVPVQFSLLPGAINLMVN